MIHEFVERFMKNKESLREALQKKHPEGYEELVKLVVGILADEDSFYNSPDPARVHIVDDGNYQGTLVFVIGACGYQPFYYWYVMVSYGSCSSCDTFERIQNYSDGTPTPQQVSDYMTLALHIVQGLRSMHETDEAAL